MAHPHWHLIVALTFAATFSGSCTTRPTTGAVPPTPPTLDVTLREYAFDAPPVATRGRLVFRVHNSGTIAHELVLVALPPDTPPVAEQLRSSNRKPVDTVAAIRHRAPTTTDTFAAELKPGRYAFVCFATDPDGVSHAAKGMSAELEVR